ncbi:MAG: hypothetical protein RR500_09175 [Bacilli bacterium]
MENYKNFLVTEEGLLFNKEYLNYLKSYKADCELLKKLEKKQINKREYNYLEQTKMRKALKSLKYETKLIKWNDLESWKITGRTDKFKLHLKIKKYNHEIEPTLIDDYNVINYLEKNCYNIGHVVRGKEFIIAKYYLYFIYFIIVVILVYVLIGFLK